MDLPDGTPTPHKVARTSGSVCGLAPAVKCVLFMSNISHCIFIVVGPKTIILCNMNLSSEDKGCKIKVYSSVSLLRTKGEYFSVCDN